MYLHLLTFVTPLMGLLLFGACAATPKPRAIDVIVIRNLSGEMLRTLTLSADTPAGATFGSVSPVPVGTPYEFIRPDRAGPLPPVLHADWTTVSGVRGHAVLNIKNELDSRPPHKTLTIILQPDGRCDVTAD